MASSVLGGKNSKETVGRVVLRMSLIFIESSRLGGSHARPDTGGLSGATPSEAVSWGKVDPARLPDAVVCYADSTIALPLITAYALDHFKPRKPKRLIDQRDRILDRVARDYKKSPFYKKFFEE